MLIELRDLQILASPSSDHDSSRHARALVRGVLAGGISGTLLYISGGAEDLPPGATLFVLDSKPYAPWWKDYFGINKNLLQVSKGAIVFRPVGKTPRTFLRRSR